MGDAIGIVGGHSIASGMGGMRTAGDLVARQQLNSGMKIREAKDYVANKLKVSVKDLSNPILMNEVRQDLNLGCIAQFVGRPKGIEAKCRIAEVLGIEINSVNRFKQKAGLFVPALRS